jgi:hypothetical protein
VEDALLLKKHYSQVFYQHNVFVQEASVEDGVSLQVKKTRIKK